MCFNWFYQDVYTRFKGDELMYIEPYAVSTLHLTCSFDYGDFKIFGSSPEAQIIVKIEKQKYIQSQETLNR
jgi:hypothetical protein